MPTHSLEILNLHSKTNEIALASVENLHTIADIVSLTVLCTSLTILVSVLGLWIKIYSLSSADRNKVVDTVFYHVPIGQPVNVCVEYRVLEEISRSLIAIFVRIG